MKTSLLCSNKKRVFVDGCKHKQLEDPKDWFVVFNSFPDKDLFRIAEDCKMLLSKIKDGKEGAS